LGELGIDHVDAVTFTHHHRDQASGVHALAKAGTRICVPAAEVDWFANAEAYWDDPAQRWHLYDFHPHNLMLAQSIPVHEVYNEGDTFEWGGATITVLSTPGHTEGSVSYQVDVRGQKGVERYLFCGDVIYDEGQIWELYSLQKGWETRDYHGFLGDRERLFEGLSKIKAANASALIPSHGTIVTAPGRAIDVLRERLTACYEQYVAISALRHYFPEMFVPFEGHNDAMPIRAGEPYPAFVHHIGTTWIVSSQDGAAFVVDCGAEHVVQEIQEMQARGALGHVEWLWITHYHDDHVDALPKFRETFGCPVVTDESVARVVEQPLAWRLPCISPVQVKVDRRTGHGESWPWHEYTITAYPFPGQTLYHGGLLVEGRGVRIFFAGDSFTMAGIDDYCAGNRNYLGEGVGFDACVALLQELEPDVILNCHVDAGFSFTDEEYRFMRANLAQRECLYRELFPWDDPNYGMDEHWVRCHPYEQRALPGDEVRLDVVFTNHSGAEREAVCRPVLPAQWQMQVGTKKAVVAPKAEGRIGFVFSLPGDVCPGRWIVPVDVTYGGRRLGPFREAIVVVERGRCRFTSAAPCT
jgi:glyoxylase-like metal-dependent hydrolase (beta-lactamase superfamily II)